MTAPGTGTGRVIVIGGGLSGITSALECARRGAEVTLLEARGRLGGAAYSFTRGGLEVDNGQHVFLRCCTAYRELLAQLGAQDMVTLQPRLDIPVLTPGAPPARLRRSGLPAPLHLTGAVARYGRLSPGERLRAARAMRALNRLDPEDPALDARPLSAWLAAQRQTPAAVDALWELIVRPTLNLAPEAASLAQVAQVFQVGLLRDSTAGDIGYARVPLSEIHDRAARRALAAAGVDVRLRRGATSILPRRGGFCVEVSAAPSVEGDAVILAVPADRAARLVPTGSGITRGRLAQLGRSPIVDLHVVLDRPVLAHPFAAGVHTPIQWVFDRTQSAGLTDGQYLVVSLSAADAEATLSVDSLRDRYLPALRELLPEMAGVAVREFFVTREHAATFRAAPGIRALRPGPATALRRFTLAGSWTATGWPATMESAVRSGHAAAAHTLAALGQAPAPRVAVPPPVALSAAAPEARV